MYEESFEIKEGILFVTLHGRFPLSLMDETDNVFAPLMKKVQENDCHRVLVDALDLQVKMETFDLFKAGYDLSVLKESIHRMALVIKMKSFDPFFETVAQNRGMQIKVFEEREEAIAWLNS